MVRNLACAALIVALTFALAPASELKGKITRVTATTITITTTPPAGERAETKTLTVDKELMVFRMEKKKRVEVSDGLKAADFKNLDKNGVTATVIINDDVKRVTEITIGTGKKK